MGLKQMFEFSSFKKKIKAEAIRLEIVKGEPIFRAIVCIAFRNEKGKFEYSEKDLRKIRELAENSNEWWKLDLDEKACWLLWYPYKFWEKHYPERLKEESHWFNLENILESFTVHIGGKR